jgi:outer membrane protein OmpA-like peptidoglycan-associated protein
MKRLFCFLILLTGLTASLFAQKSSRDSIGDVVNFSAEVSDTANNSVNMQIPIKGNYVLVYRYRWKGVDNADSVRLLEEKISTVLLGGMIGRLTVICLAYDMAANYDTWKQNIKTQKPFRPTNKYRVEYYNLNGNMETEKKCRELFTKLTLFGPDGKVLKFSSSIGKFYYHMKEEKINLKGKVVTVTNGVKQPLHEAVVHVQAGNKIDTLAKGTTDIYGDFDLKISNSDTAYTIKASPKSKDVKNVLLLTQEGKEISYLRESFKSFEYKLLKADILEMTDMVEDMDVSLTVKNFEAGKEKELLMIEDILYARDKFDIEKASEPRLNQVVAVLKQNPKIRLEIISHTDAQGDDSFNLNLSEKRARAVADYLIRNGVEEKRLTATGKGETQIRNRCFNNVSCSDKEQAYNRRTEFRFIK